MSEQDDEEVQTDVDAVQRDRSSELLEALRGLPLLDDVFLIMQAQNIAIVDASLLEWELEVLRLHIEIERTPLPQLMTLSAFSQLWVFGLYELLRTWRQRASELVTFAEKFAKLQGADQIAFLEKALRAADSPSGLPGLQQTAYERRLRQATQPEFVDELRGALARVDPAFRSLENLRVTLAKHEIPKTKGKPSFAPGYARQNMSDGSLVWTVEHKDGGQELVSRTSIAEQLISELQEGYTRDEQ